MCFEDILGITSDLKKVFSKSEPDMEAAFFYINKTTLALPQSLSA